MTDSQLFSFQGGAGPLSLAPQNAKGQTCFAVRGNVVDAAACNANDAAQVRLAPPPMYGWCLGADYVGRNSHSHEPEMIRPPAIM